MDSACGTDTLLMTGLKTIKERMAAKPMKPGATRQERDRSPMRDGEL